MIVGIRADMTREERDAVIEAAIERYNRETAQEKHRRQQQFVQNTTKYVSARMNYSWSDVSAPSGTG